jgi:hypothetical protein
MPELNYNFTPPKNFDTPLSKKEEKQYQSYKKALKDRGNEIDYDLRGYWKEEGRFIPVKSALDESHFTDKWKKPNHPGFSNESVYHNSINKDGTVNIGGQWLVGPDGRDTYVPPAKRYMDPQERMLIDYYLTRDADPAVGAGRMLNPALLEYYKSIVPQPQQ